MLTIEDLKYGVEVVDLGADAARATCAEALVAREARDVIARFKEWNTGFPVEKFKADYVIGWVLANYYAPIAPAVVNGRTAEGWMAEALLQKSVADDIRKSVPAVPGEIVNNSQAKALLWELFGDDPVCPAEVAAAVWNACRAAMLGGAK